MIKVSNALALAVFAAGSTFGGPLYAARTDPSALTKETPANLSALDSLDDTALEALAICPECKRRFLRDHRWTEDQYAEMLQERGKAVTPGSNGSTTGQ